MNVSSSSNAKNFLQNNCKVECVNACLKIIGDKWTALIIRELLLTDKSFSELEKFLVGISPRTLSQRLDKLINYNIVSKSLYCDKPPRYNYSLTEKGRDLGQVILQFAHWGDKYYSDCLSDR